MRKMKPSELEKASNMMVDIFFDKIDIAIVTEGINPETAKKIIYETLYSDLEYFQKYGEIFVYDDDMSGIVVLIDGRKFSYFKKLMMSLKSNKKMMQIATKQELQKLNENAKKTKEIHSFNWYKKRKNTPYYLAHLGIDENKRGTGICREMLEFVFDYVKDFNNEIVLETFNDDNVPIYEHFGFEMVDIVESKDKSIKEYRMLKKL